MLVMSSLPPALHLLDELAGDIASGALVWHAQRVAAA